MWRLPHIRGTQVGLRHPELVDAIKADMLAGRYRFESPEGQIGGIRDSANTYHIMEGHHRMAAALELFREIKDDQYVQKLLRFGQWDESAAPSMSRPMPGRYWWGRMRNWIGC